MSGRTRSSSTTCGFAITYGRTTRIAKPTARSSAADYEDAKRAFVARLVEMLRRG